jgi:hypothetical protein
MQPMPVPPDPPRRRPRIGAETDAVRDLPAGHHREPEAPFGWWDIRRLNGQVPPAPQTAVAAPAHTYAVVEYEPATGRVRWVIGMFDDLLSAEEYAISHDLPHYDIFPATIVLPRLL